jgi:hypothetical protein
MIIVFIYLFHKTFHIYIYIASYNQIKFYKNYINFSLFLHIKKLIEILKNLIVTCNIEFYTKCLLTLALYIIFIYSTKSLIYRILFIHDIIIYILEFEESRFVTPEKVFNFTYDLFHDGEVIYVSTGNTLNKYNLMILINHFQNIIDIHNREAVLYFE